MQQSKISTQPMNTSKNSGTTTPMTMKQPKKSTKKYYKTKTVLHFFAIEDDGTFHGFCHGDYFQTFWMSGLTCYVSSLITNEEDRGKGYGVKLLDYAKKLAKERGCKAITLDSGLPRVQAHGFYEHYGFEKSCYGFELAL